MSVIDLKAKQEQIAKNGKIVLLVLALAGCILLIRLWYLQIIKGEHYNQLSQNNRIRVRRVRALRGIIYDRNKNIVADNHPGFNLSIIPENIADIKAVAAELGKHLATLNEDRIIKEFNAIPSYLRYRPLKIKNNLTRDELALLEAHKIDLPGILIEVEPIRHYPYGEACAHLIGYQGFINEQELGQPSYASYYADDLVGRSGIEAQYEELLRGTDGARQVEVNAIGRELNSRIIMPTEAGNNIILTIDIDLQQYLHELMQDSPGSAVAIDPHSGDILAMVSSPSFSNNLFATRISQTDWEAISNNPLRPLQNRAIQGQYPPGSTFKPIIAAAALEDNIVTPKTRFFCGGSFQLGSSTFRCWNKYGHGEVNVSRSLKESCDVYYYQIGNQLPIDRIAHYCSLFGLGKKSGISLPQEKAGFIPTSSWKLEHFHDQWYRGETLSVAIGQGYILTTPLQMAAAYVPFANSGTYYQPRLVAEISNPQTQGKHSTDQESYRLPIAQNHFELIREALWKVVNEKHGTAYNQRITAAGLEMAGKTGTAQVVAQTLEEVEEGGEVPWQYRDHAWFVAFAPYRNPKIVISVLVEHGGHGGSTAAPIAQQAIIHYLQHSDL
ncbi:MAG: penicillin-binding protein 2 [Deltaproteobacteria bacterium]|nr:penicillin-binding protein 2 [Candidatus Anaeroferrophillus wilburensis]MBN2888177.1 penicillin-binding protein 2 [Deltaproteobacteria bacterium]